MNIPVLCEIYAVCFVSVFSGLLVRALLLRLAPRYRIRTLIWRVLRRTAHKVQFRRLIGRRFLVGPWYVCGSLLYVLFLAFNVAALSLHIRRTGPANLSVRFTTLSDAASRATYLALLNLTVIYLSPHHYGVADTFGLSLQACKQVHRVIGQLSLCLILFPIVVALANDPRSAFETDEGKFGVMVCLLLQTATEPCAYCCRFLPVWWPWSWRPSSSGLRTRSS